MPTQSSTNTDDGVKAILSIGARREVIIHQEDNQTTNMHLTETKKTVDVNNGLTEQTKFTFETRAKTNGKERQSMSIRY